MRFPSRSLCPKLFLFGFPAKQNIFAVPLERREDNRTGIKDELFFGVPGQFRSETTHGRGIWQSPPRMWQRFFGRVMPQSP
jgi:hypothetical protein